jgi:predicted deacylase
MTAYVVNGANGGETIWIQGCIHGDEQVGGLAVRDLVLDLEPGDVTGTIIVVPVGNASGFVNKQRETAVSEHGTNDVNRVFPGRPEGTYPERLAYILSSTVKDAADYFVDCHSVADETLMEPGFTMLNLSGDSETDDVAMEMARIADLLRIIPTRIDEKGYGSMSDDLSLAGVPSILIETRGSGPVRD